MMNVRRDMRHHYSIKGNMCLDCVASGFCPCCALLQEEKELTFRASIGPSGSQPPAYEPSQEMMYAPDAA